MRRSSVLTMAVLLAGKGVSLVIVLGLARAMPPSDYGVFVFARNLLLILGPIATLGWSVSAVGFLPSYLATHRPERAKGFYLAAIRVTVLTALAVAVSLFGAIALIPGLLDAPFRPAVTIGLAGLIGYALIALNAETARALGLVGAAYVPNHIGHPMLFIGLLGALSLASVPIDGVTATFALALSYSAVAVLQLALIRSSAPEPFRRARPTWSVREWFGASAPLTLVTASMLIIELSPPVILGLFAQAWAVGAFGVIIAMVQTLSILNWSLFRIASPRITASIARDCRPERLLRVVRLVAGVGGLAASAALVLVVATIGPLALPHLVPPLDTLGIALFSYLCTAFAGPVGTVLIAFDRRRELVVCNLASAVLTIGTAVVLIPALGINGAALAGAIGCLVRALLLGIIVHGRHQFGW
jgi:O-antigen/teichoic acid export membrane protein